ncbi:MAG: hypothetical protein FOGNACKC_00301 [Anaerolineae bacterium]|nr:hypothetical protein [Anaerolineae bacterium]
MIEPYATAMPKLNGQPKQAAICGACGYHNPVTAAICLNCNTALANHCPICGHSAPVGSNFCGACGAKLSAAAPTGLEAASAQMLQQRQALAPKTLASKLRAAGGSGEVFGENRDVTLLVLTLIFSSPDDADLDEEELYFMQDEILKALGQVVKKYEGTLEKYTQNGLVAFFGAPTAHENDPERAVRAALEMRQLIQARRRELQSQTNLALSARFGLHTGAVVAGTVGNNAIHADYTVVGNAVQVTRELELSAAAGDILISSATYQQVRSICDCTALSPITQSDPPAAIERFKVAGLLDSSEVKADALMPQLLMIGRANELDQLRTTLATVVERGRSRVALITGEAGLGKSRLVAEFRHLTLTSEVTFAQGTCLAYTHAVPLGVVTNLLRNLIGVTETTPAEAQHHKLDSFLQSLPLPEKHEISPYLLHALGLPQAQPLHLARLQALDAAMLQRQTHAALRQVILALAHRQPTVLIFEDLQWVDAASRSFLEYLVQTTDDVPLLLLFVARAAERKTVLQALITQASLRPEQYLDLQLSPLTQQEAWHLLDQLNAHFSVEAHQLKQKIIERAEGNPLFLEEIVRTLIDQKGLQRDPNNGQWQVTNYAVDLLQTIPGTVKGLLLARVDSLPEAMRRTLQQAAVFGTDFATEVLLQVSNLPALMVAEQLKEMEARQFLVSRSFRNAPGYIFRHKLMQETIYNTLVKRDRQKIHTLAARVIEQSGLWLADEQAEVLAYHYAESNVPLKAIPHLMTAGDNALRRCAYETAIHHYRQVKTLLPSRPDNQFQPEYFKGRIGLATALKFTGALAEADRILSDMLLNLWYSNLSANPGSLEQILIESLRQMADIRQRGGVFDQALNYLQVGLQLLSETTQQHNPAARLALLERIAWVYFRQGKLDAALAVAQPAVDNAPQGAADSVILLASLHNTLGGIAWQQNNLAKAISHVQQSLQLYDDLGYLYGAAIAYGNLGILYYQQGNWHKAIRYYERAYTGHQMIGNRDGVAVSLDNRGLLSLAMGKLEQAKTDLEEALVIRQHLGDTWGVAQTCANLAQVALMQANLEAAEHYALQALHLSQSIDSVEVKAEAFWISALVHAENGRLNEGLEMAEQALILSRQAGITQQEAHSLRILGGLHRRLDNFADAELLLNQALELSQSRNDPYLQGQILLELGQLYQQKASNKAESCFEKATLQFEKLGALWYLHVVRTTRGV